jgi:queuine tRNA-ribosyltransferase accessory subunit
MTTLLAPRRIPAVSAPNGSTEDAISIFTSVGFQPLSAKVYTEHIQKLHPDIAVGLGDVPYGALPGTKRVAKMGDRTLNWLESILSTLGNSSTTDSESKISLPSSAIFAPILPIDFHAQWEYLHHLADDLAGSISGLAIYSSRLLPDIPATTTLSQLPRLSLDEPSSPQQILRQVSLGMDLFVVPFIGAATDGGLALTFQFPRTDYDAPDIKPGDHGEGEDKEPPAVSSRIKPLAIDLSLATHATSLTPLLPSCACYTCTTHHRAFVQHLLSAKEMLGWALLQIHNHHVVSRFFVAVRASIARGTFEDDRAVFESVYDAVLPEGMGQRPRARGYHFKSEGPGEKKRNKPAWSALSDGEGDAGRGREKSGEERDEEAESSPDGDSSELEQEGFAGVVGERG